jgi:hypothetical protein
VSEEIQPTKDAIWKVFDEAERSCKSEGWIILDLLDILDRGVTVATIRAELESWTADLEEGRRRAEEAGRRLAEEMGWTTRGSVK